MKWRRVSSPSPDTFEWPILAHRIVISTETARAPLVVRLLKTDHHDVVSIKLVHLDHTPFSFTSKVDTFLDIWIDPFEFDSLKYDMDRLPVPLTIELLWRTTCHDAQAFVPLEMDSDHWYVEWSVEREEIVVKETEKLNAMKEWVNSFSAQHGLEQRAAADTMFVLATLLSGLMRPDRLIEKTTQASKTRASVESSTSVLQEKPMDVPQNVAQKGPMEGGDEIKARAKAMLIHNAIKYWPSFRESKLTSWLSTVVNATVRDWNDKNESDIPEDLDIIEMICSSYPTYPWSKPNPVMSNMVIFLHGVLEAYLKKECLRHDWRESFAVSALAMAYPHMSICIPNNEDPRFYTPWSYGNVVRNILYAFIYVYLGTDPTQWLVKLNIYPEQIRQICMWATNLTFLFTESNFELFLKRVIMLFIKTLDH